MNREVSMRSLGLPISKANRLLLICDSEANIGTVDANVVFIEGTTSILETSHQHVLGMNFFSVGLTLKSLLQLHQVFQGVVLSHDRDYKVVECDLVKRREINAYRQLSSKLRRGESSKDEQLCLTNFIKRLNIRCSVLRVTMAEHEVVQRQVPVVLESPGEQYDQLLVLMEISLADSRLTKDTDIVDYEYTIGMLEDTSKMSND